MTRGIKPAFLSLDEKEIMDKLNKSASFEGFIKSLGYTSGRNQHTRIAVIKYLESKDINYKDYLASNRGIEYRRRIPDDEYFVLGTKYRTGNSFAKRYKSKVDNYACSICGLSTWMGKEITLQVDHINGDHYDNRLENLRFLCPNCHSQTPTYGNKRGKSLY